MNFCTWRLAIVTLSIQFTTINGFQGIVPFHNQKTFTPSQTNFLKARSKLSTTHLSYKNYKTTEELNSALSELQHKTEETGNIEFAFQAEELLLHSSDDHENLQSYYTVMHTWKAAAQKLAEGSAIISRNKEGKHHEGGDVYTARDAAERAHRLLKQLEIHYAYQNEDIDDSSHSSGNNLRPDVFGYNTVIEAWSRSRVNEACQTTLEIFKRMESLQKNGYQLEGGSYTEPWDWLSPNVITYNSLLDACVVNRQQQQQLNEYDVTPQVYHDDTMTQTSLKFGGVQTAEQIFKMVKNSDVKPNARTYNYLINAWAKHTDLYHPFSNPSITHDPVKKQFCNNETKRAALRAEQLLEELTQLHKDSDYDSQFKPDVMTYTSVIDCIARSQIKQAPQKAEALLAELEHKFKQTKDTSLRPNVRTYTAVIHAWSRSRYETAPHRAEQILERMEQFSQPHHHDSNSFGEDINKLSYSKQMVKPNVRTYTIVISCWVRSQELTKPQRALKLLKRMSDQYKVTKDPNIQPNLYIYNAVIDACGKCPAREHDHPDQQRAALKIAFAVHKAIQLDSSVRPNHITYALLLKAVNNLMPRAPDSTEIGGREEIVEKLFIKAKEDGMVDPNVIKQIRQTVGSDFFVSLIGQTSNMLDKTTARVDFSKCPPEWGKNVK